MQLAKEKRKFQLPFHVVRRLDVNPKRNWILRIIGFIVAFFLAGVLTTILKPGTFGSFFVEMFKGVFDAGDPDIFTGFLEKSAILLLLALALIPAFKMKYWNIGAEGCATIGCLITAVVTSYMPSSMPDFLVLIIAVVASMLGAVIWSLIPAIFKAIFNTNETLFTLMMNYVAIFLTTWIVTNSNRTASGTWGTTNVYLPDIAGIKYIIPIVIVIIVTVLMWFYLKKTKHGYEISVVGGSPDTARYVGINKKVIIIRTLILSGALCGLAGFLMVAGNQHTLRGDMVGGQGFTGVLIAWLGHFDPLEVIIYSCLCGFFSKGAFNAASYVGMDQNIFSGIVTGLFFLIVIAFEFFANYKVLKREKENVKNKEPDKPDKLATDANKGGK